VTPANPTIGAGTTQQYTAPGTFSDSSTQNLTSTVPWASATPSVATINSAGLATGVGSGASTISATQGAVSGSTVLTVNAAVPALNRVWFLLLMAGLAGAAVMRMRSRGRAARG
jgi:hypothetical protein